MISTGGAWSTEVRCVLQGGEIPVDTDVLPNNSVRVLGQQEVNALRNAGLNKVYFRECDLTLKQGSYAKHSKHAPYRENVSGDALDPQGFPKSQCGAFLGEDFKYKAKDLDKATNFIAEIFATSNIFRPEHPAPPAHPDAWYRVGIIHVHRWATVAELKVICLDAGLAIDDGANQRIPLFHNVINFALEFARGKARKQTETAESNVLVKYQVDNKPYGNDPAGTAKTDTKKKMWKKIGKYVFLDASSLKSMTAYMSMGFQYCPLSQQMLYNGRKIGYDVMQNNQKDLDNVGAYLAMCTEDRKRIQRQEDISYYFTEALWAAMCTLSAFKNHQGVRNVQKQFTLVTDEQNPDKMDQILDAKTCTLGDCFAYASFALSVALALVYAHPQEMLDENEEQRNAFLIKLQRVLSEVGAQPKSKELVHNMIDLSQEIKSPTAAIPMVVHNRRE